MDPPMHNVTPFLLQLCLFDLFRSSSQFGGDLVKCCLRLPRTHVWLAWRAPGWVCLSNYDTFQDSTLLDAAVLLRWVCGKA